MENELFHQMAELEESHWWFVGRRCILKKIIDCFVEFSLNAQILNVGCGTGGNLNFLSQYGNVTGLEVNDEALQFAKKRGIEKIYWGRIPDNLPFSKSSFDLITLLDVLEHVDDDEKALRALVPLLKPEGYLLITVPALSFLWSNHDVSHHHKRRYSLTELNTKIKNNGLCVEYSSYINSLLFPIIAFIRILKSRADCFQNKSDLYVTNAFMNKLLAFIFSSKRHFVGKIKLPIGVSVIACGKKQ